MIYDRSYQIEAVGSIWSYFAAKSGNPVLAMPTGTGKSIVIARFLQSVFNRFPNQRVMMLTHVKELIRQNLDKLMQAWPFAPVGVYSAGLNVKDSSKPITFAGIASVAKKWALFGHIDLVLIDEVHLVSPNDETLYQTFLQGLYSINPNLKVIGFTATPWRLGHGLITDPVITPSGEEKPSLFSDFCFDITGIEPFNRLIAEGFLLPLVPAGVKSTLSVDGVHMRGGEFIESELQTAVDKYEITEKILREAMEYGANRRKWLIFASGVEHSDHIADMLTAMGVPTGSVHSKRKDRDKTIEDFRAGRLRAVVNNNVLTTGFDDPEIDMIVCARPTASPVLWVQMLGRGTRPSFMPGFNLNEMAGRLQSIAASSKHNCLVLDFAANTRRLGPINDPVIPKRKGKTGGEAPVKCCEACGSWQHASVRYCTAILPSGLVCGNEFTFEVKLKQTASTQELVKGDMPIVETFAVDHITIVRQPGRGGKPDMVKVSYFCGLQMFNEYVCVESDGYAYRKAKEWWRKRTHDPMPTKVADALSVISTLPQATHLRVWVNKQWPEILSVCLDGSNFGMQPVSDSFVPPPTEVDTGRSSSYSAEQSRSFASTDFNDDIPF